MKRAEEIRLGRCLNAEYKDASKRAAEYVQRRLGVAPIGCCRPNHTKLTENDTAVVVCNNCAAIIEENTDARIEFLWQVIDQDPDFPFPDYHGEEMTIQDCWVSFENIKTIMDSRFGKPLRKAI